MWSDIAFVTSIAAFIVIFGGLRWALRQEHYDILKRGVPTVGTVRTIRSRSLLFGRVWWIAVEFNAGNHEDPIRTTVETASGAWTRASESISQLQPGVKVALHYQRLAPSIAVIDSLPPTFTARAFRFPTSNIHRTEP